MCDGVAGTATYTVTAGEAAGIAVVGTAYMSGTPQGGMFGQNGVQTASKTVYNKDGLRIGLETPNPGQRPGQIHAQIGDNKFLYDPATKSFPGAPRSLRELLEMQDVQDAIAKALRMPGE